MQWLTSAEACEKFNVTANTLRSWDKLGKILTTRTIGNQRRYSSHLLSEQVVPQSSPAQNVIYCRVSTFKQRDDLHRQIATMQAAHPNCDVISDIASGLNYHRKGLNSLLQRTVSGSLKTVPVAHKDRLARFGYELIETILQLHGVEIRVEDDTNHSPAEELQTDLLNVLHVFACRANGQRRYKRKGSDKEKKETIKRTKSVKEEEAKCLPLPLPTKSSSETQVDRV